MKLFIPSVFSLTLLITTFIGASTTPTWKDQTETQVVNVNFIPGFDQPAFPPVPPHVSSSKIEIIHDGMIMIGGQVFSSFEDYIQSQFFLTENKRCGTASTSIMHADQINLNDCNFSQTIIRPEYMPSAVMIIPVVFHVIYNNDPAQTGNIPDQRIIDQIKVLNEDFRAISGTLGALGSDTKIQFELAGITRTQNSNWFYDNDEIGYKSALGWNQEQYLNIYTNTASGYLGYAYFPQTSTGLVEDGVVVLYEAVGGRENGFDIYDEGRTLTHEIGHYLGLLHTFEGNGCYVGYNTGDLINDTNSENVEHYSCLQTNTCGTPDPITNYMNYTPDDCMNNFTLEQVNRMTCALRTYRPQLYHFEYTNFTFLPMLKK